MAKRSSDRRVTATHTDVEREIRALRREIKIQREADQEALRIQRKEYMRRLIELNGAHERATKEQARTLPRDMFEQYAHSQVAVQTASAKEFQQWKDGVNAAITANRVWAVVVGFVVAAAVSLAGNFISRINP